MGFFNGAEARKMSTDDEDQTSLLGKHRSDPPQRFSNNFARYQSLEGLVRPNEFLRGSFHADGTFKGDMSRFYFFCLALDVIAKEGLQGDIAELGVYKGGTAAVLAKFARTLGRTAYLFDTFEGFDESDLTGLDAGTPVGFIDTSMDYVRAAIGDDSVNFIKGRFPETTSAIPEDTRFCLVHLDCDLYAPMRDALEFFYQRLVPGGFLIVHDYSSLCWDGPERALDRFLIGKSECVIPLPDSAGSAVIRKSRGSDTAAHWLTQRRVASLTGGWIKTANGALSHLLGDGWSHPENWGIWGVGAVHELLLFLPTHRLTELDLEADVHAPLAGPDDTKLVDVMVSGQNVTTWRFTSEKNRDIRVARFPKALVASAASNQMGCLLFTVEFRPRSVFSPKAAGHNQDDRPLGLALSALRLHVAHDRLDPVVPDRLE
jgi:hypothetical protein